MNIKLRRISIIYVLFFYIFLVFYLFFLFGNSFLKYLESINCCFILILTLFSIFLLGIRENKMNRLKNNILSITFVVILVYFTLSYSIGLFNGFLRNSFSLKITNILNNSIFVILTIIFSEIFRYVMINSDRDSSNNFIVITFLMCLLEFSNCFNAYNYRGPLELVRLFSLCLFPMVIKNSVLSYLCKYGGFYPCLLYRLLIECYIYFVPIIPNLGDFLDSSFLAILPFYIYSSCSRVINDHLCYVEHDFTENAFKIWDIPIMGSLIFLIILVSGITPFYLAGIGSASMEPSIKVGDAVVLKKTSNHDTYRVGDVIAFKKGGVTIVHRIVDVIEDEGKFYYDTKGDNNNCDDGIYLGIDDIEGVYLFRIPFIAKISIWFNESLGD